MDTASAEGAQMAAAERPIVVKPRGKPCDSAQPFHVVWASSSGESHSGRLPSSDTSFHSDKEECETKTQSQRGGVYHAHIIDKAMLSRGSFPVEEQRWLCGNSRQSGSESWAYKPQSRNAGNMRAEPKYLSRNDSHAVSSETASSGESQSSDLPLKAIKKAAARRTTRTQGSDTNPRNFNNMHINLEVLHSDCRSSATLSSVGSGQPNSPRAEHQDATSGAPSNPASVRQYLIDPAANNIVTFASPAEENDNLQELLERVPLDENGLPSSIGSIGHHEGTCKSPCMFVLTGKGCSNGIQCSFCHLLHQKYMPRQRAKKPRPCKGKRERYRRQWEKVKTQLEDNPDAFEVGDVEIPPSIMSYDWLKGKFLSRIKTHQDSLKSQRAEQLEHGLSEEASQSSREVGLQQRATFTSPDKQHFPTSSQE